MWKFFISGVEIFRFYGRIETKTKNVPTRDEKCPYQRRKISTTKTKYFHTRDKLFHSFRKGMKHFHTSKEIIGAKHLYTYLTFTVTFLFWCGKCSTLLGQCRLWFEPKTIKWHYLLAGLGTAFFCILNVSFFCVLLKNATFFYVFFEFLATYETQKNDACILFLRT